MIELFNNLIGNVPMDPDLKIVLAALFLFLLFSSFLRFIELLLIQAFGRRK